MSGILQAFDAHEKQIRRIFARYCRRSEDIEDLTQEAFLKAFAAELKTDIKNPKAFLFRVAKNLALSEIKRKINTTTDYIEDSGGSEVLRDKQQASIESQIDGRRKLIIATKIIAGLRPEYRRALLMRKVDQLKFKQIATRLGVSVSLVEKRVASALLICNSELRAQGYDPTEFGAALTSAQNQRQKAGRLHISKMLKSSQRNQKNTKSSKEIE